MWLADSGWLVADSISLERQKSGNVRAPLSTTRTLSRIFLQIFGNRKEGNGERDSESRSRRMGESGNAGRANTIAVSPFRRFFRSDSVNQGRGWGVGRGLGVALGVAVGVGVTVGVAVGVGVTVGVGVGVTVGVGVGVGPPVGDTRT
jgi:hypothetical protein